MNTEQRTVAVGLSEVLERLEPRSLDLARSTAAADDTVLRVVLAHRTRPELTIELHASRGEIVVSYGHEHEHFRSDDAASGRVWPFSSGDHVDTALAFVDGLLAGRIELHVWKRPLAVRTTSFWIDDEGDARPFLRGATMVPMVGWSRTPEVYRFDFT